MVFALFSYPLSDVRFDVLLSLFLMVAALGAPFPWWGRLAGSIAAAAVSFFVITRGPEYPPFRSIYEVGYHQFQDAQYEAAIETLSEGAEISSDPMFHIIAGRCHEALGHTDAAAEEYETAQFMALGRQIVAMPVNERNLSMVRLHDETLHQVDSLKNVLP